MKSVLEKKAVSEAKIVLLKKIVYDLEGLPEDVKMKYKRKILNYKRSLTVEEQKIKGVLNVIKKNLSSEEYKSKIEKYKRRTKGEDVEAMLNCIQKEYPHACKCK